MQQKGLLFYVFCLLCMPMTSLSADLMADEQGPTASEAVTTLTANDDFLLPSYVVPAQPSNETEAIPSEVDILNEIFGSDPVSLKVPATVSHRLERPVEKTFYPQKGIQTQSETPLLTALPSLPVINSEEILEPKKSYFNQPKYADQALAEAAMPSSGIGIPREIRITFYQGQSTFSAQALKWVKSFAVHVVNNPMLLAVVRISDQNQKLQERRLNILLHVLKEMGVSRHQIRLYKTGRDENSILIGYAENPEFTSMKSNKKTKEGKQKTINW